MTFTPEQIRNGQARSADLYAADLRSADLRGADLYRANLTGANLYRANLYRANLYGANLYGANLNGANLNGANLNGANLNGANLRSVQLSSVNLSESRGIQWAQVGPIGTDRRTLTAIRQPWGDSEASEIILHAGCFGGTPQQFADQCNAGGGDWGWRDRGDEMRDQCLAAMHYLINHHAFK